MKWLDKYKEGGEIMNVASLQDPIAQDGRTIYYQNGLDWKPRSMQYGGGIDWEKERKTRPSFLEDFTNPSGIDNALLLRQAWKESSFRPNITNRLGFKGLAQVGDDVINDYKKKNNIKKFNPHNPKDAKAIQEWYMNDLYNSKFINKPNQSDEVRKAKTLASYNWGRTNVSKTLTKLKKSGKDIYNSMDWLNELPAETNDYVNKILGQDEGFNKEFDSVINLPKYEKIVNTYNYKNGGVIEDDRGQWAHPGKVTKINSNNITMKGVEYPVIGISNTGDEKLMMPGADYRFDGDTVTEYPQAQNGEKITGPMPLNPLTLTRLDPYTQKKEEMVIPDVRSNYIMPDFISTTPDQVDWNTVKQNNPQSESFVDRMTSDWSMKTLKEQTGLSGDQLDNVILKGATTPIITGDPGKGRNAYFDNDEGIIKIRKGVDKATILHEEAHSSGLDVLQGDNLQKVLGNAYHQDNVSSSPEMKQELNKPHETYGHFSGFRKRLGITPGQQLTEKQLDALVKKKKLENEPFYKSFDKAKIIKALNTIAYNNSPSSNKYKTAQDGIELNLNNIQNPTPPTEEEKKGVDNYINNIQLNIPGKIIKGRPDKNKNLLSFLIPDKQTRGTGKNTIFYEELANYYKGDQEYPYKYLSKSEYKPTKSKDEDKNYIAIKSDNFKNRILDLWNNSDNIPKNRQSVKHHTKRINDNEMHIFYEKGVDALGNFNMHKGKDEKGEYISYYDLWDVGKPADFIGKPFEVYDRIYVDKDSTGKYIPKNKLENGGELQKLDQITNFTNYNTPQPSGWLNKYSS